MFSPASISAVFAVTHAGASGETAEELRAAFHFPGDPDTLHAGFSTLLDAWRTREGIELAVANRLFGQQSLGFRPSFIELSGRYGAPLETMPLWDDPAGSVEAINKWVAAETRESITDILPPGSLAAQGVGADLPLLVLVNAVYLDAKWASPFDDHDEREFYTPEGAQTIMMIAQTSAFAYGRDPEFGVDFVDLPYVDDRMSMLLVRPVARDGLPEVEAGLDAEALARWAREVNQAEPERVHITMPKFETEFGLSLPSVLAELGVERAFAAQHAQFDAMVESRESMPMPYLRDTFHKARIAVDDERTVASAATATFWAGVYGGAIQAPPIEFMVDRPFLYFVRDRQSGAVLFMGRVNHPLDE